MSQNGAQVDGHLEDEADGGIRTLNPGFTKAVLYR